MESLTECLTKCFPCVGADGFLRRNRVSPEILSGFSTGAGTGRTITKSVIVDESHGRTRRLSEELKGEINLHYVSDGADENESHVVIECPVFEFPGGTSSSSSSAASPILDLGSEPTTTGFDARRKRANSVIDEKASYNSSNSYLTTLFIETAKRKQLRVIHLRAIEESDDDENNDNDEDQVDNTAITKKRKTPSKQHLKDPSSSSSEDEDEYWFSKWSRRPRLKKFVTDQQQQQRRNSISLAENNKNLSASAFEESKTRNTVLANNNISNSISIAKNHNNISSTTSCSNYNNLGTETESQDIVQALNPYITASNYHPHQGETYNNKESETEKDNDDEEDEDAENEDKDENNEQFEIFKSNVSLSPRFTDEDVIDGVEVEDKLAIVNNENTKFEPGGSTSKNESNNGRTRNSSSLSPTDSSLNFHTGSGGFTNLAFQPDDEEDLENDENGIREDNTDETAITNTKTNSSTNKYNYAISLTPNKITTSNISSNITNTSKTTTSQTFEESQENSTIKHPLQFTSIDSGDNTHMDNNNSIRPEEVQSLVPSSTSSEPTKPLLFFIHGISGSIETWKSQIDYFHSIGYEIVALDLLGHGLSGTPTQAKLYLFESLVQDVVTVFDHFVPEESERQVVIIGHGYGACLATVLTRVRPKNARILISIAGGGPTPMVSSYWCQPTWLSFPCQFFPRKKKAGRFDNPELKHILPRNIHDNILLGQIWLDGDPAFHRRITIPTLLVYGMRDKVVNLVEVCEMERTIPRAFLELMPAASHMVMWDEPQKLNRMIRKFIQAQWS